MEDSFFAGERCSSVISIPVGTIGSESYKVAEKLGINGIGAANDFRAVIGQDYWKPENAMKTEKANEVQPSNVI